MANCGDRSRINIPRTAQTTHSDSEFAGETVSMLLVDVRHLCEQLEDSETELRQQVNKMLNLTEIRALQQRIQSLLETACFPNPGPGPNHPWPPV
jgi:hypothetical protein